MEAGLVAAGRLLPESRAQQRYWLGLRALLPSWQRVWIDPQVAPYGEVRAGPWAPGPLLPGCAVMEPQRPSCRPELQRLSCGALAAAPQLQCLSCSASAAVPELQRLKCSAPAAAPELPRAPCRRPRATCTGPPASPTTRPAPKCAQLPTTPRRTTAPGAGPTLAATWPCPSCAACWVSGTAHGPAACWLRLLPCMHWWGAAAVPQRRARVCRRCSAPAARAAALHQPHHRRHIHAQAAAAGLHGCGGRLQRHGCTPRRVRQPRGAGGAAPALCSGCCGVPQQAVERACPAVQALTAALHACLQVGVEQFYQAGGWLLPGFHQRYWIGLQAGLGLRGVGFGWLDRSLPSECRPCKTP